MKLLIFTVQILTPVSSKSRNKRITTTIELSHDVGEQPVVVTIYSSEAFQISELINVIGPFTHMGGEDVLTIAGDPSDQCDWVDINDKDYEKKTPSDRKPRVWGMGVVSKSDIADVFILSGTQYCGGPNKDYRVWILKPNNARFGRTPNPPVGSMVYVRGELSYRHSSGLYIVDLVKMTFTSKANEATTPSPSKRIRNGTSKPTPSKVAEFDPDEVDTTTPAPHVNAEASGSGTQAADAEAEELVEETPTKALKGKGRRRR